MKHVILSLTVLCTAVATVIPPAWATDLCVDVNNPNVAVHIVGKKFTVPLKNTCKPFIGFLQAGGVIATAAGAGCTSSDGQFLRLHVTAHGDVLDYSFSFECNVLLPSLSGGNCRGKFIDNNDVIVSFPAPSPATSAHCTDSIP